ncbi:MAG: SDR family oxidoreductase [Ideonella sp.]|nr:SDR family oxidoreductase [Ideonella sp.]
MTQAASTLLVTGASRGIGAATALLAAQRGWNVAVNYTSNAAAAEDVAAQVRALGRLAITAQADVADETAVRAMFARIDAEMPPLGGLVNNAGIVGMKARLDEMESARWRRLLDVNVFGSLLCAQLALLRMSTRHGGQGGAIVNLSSMAATLGSPAMYVDYAATKGAIDSFTIGLARELAGEGIRVNAIRPGIIDTDIHTASGEPDRAQTAAGMIPMKRPGTASEVAHAIVWLLSDEASYTTGTIFDVSGGR